MKGNWYIKHWFYSLHNTLHLMQRMADILDIPETCIDCIKYRIICGNITCMFLNDLKNILCCVNNVLNRHPYISHIFYLILRSLLTDLAVIKLLQQKWRMYISVTHNSLITHWVQLSRAKNLQAQGFCLNGHGLYISSTLFSKQNWMVFILGFLGLCIQIPFFESVIDIFERESWRCCFHYINRSTFSCNNNSCYLLLKLALQNHTRNHLTWNHIYKIIYSIVFWTAHTSLCCSLLLVKMCAVMQFCVCELLWCIVTIWRGVFQMERRQEK